MNRPTRYREIVVSGTPQQMGEQIGEEARDEVRGFCDLVIEHVQKTCAISRESAYEIARRSCESATTYSPDMVDELRATAVAANVTIDDLMLLQVRNQLRPSDDSGCTAVSIAPSSSLRRGAIVAQNWDADPDLDAFTIVLTRCPIDRPSMMSCTQAGLIAYLGLNSTGIGACVNSLPAPSREVGVPHYFTLRGILEATSLDTAYNAVDRAYRAIPANILLNTPQGPADFEVTIDRVNVLRPTDTDWLTHSNHCLHESLIDNNELFPELIQSHARKQRADLLVDDGACDVSAVMSLLRDHEDYPRSICRHVNSDEPHGFWATVFSIVMEPEQGKMYVSRGNPCEQPYETYTLPGR